MILYLLKLLDEFPDTVGFARIVQALQATEWPDLHMKGDYKGYWILGFDSY